MMKARNVPQIYSDKDNTENGGKVLCYKSRPGRRGKRERESESGRVGERERERDRERESD